MRAHSQARKELLTSSQVRILKRLIEGGASGASRDALVRALYWDTEEPDAAEKVLQVQICAMRRHLKPRGIFIITADRRGYEGARYFMPAASRDIAAEFLKDRLERLACAIIASEAAHA